MDNSKQITQYLEELAKALNDLQVTIPFHILIAGGATNPPSSGTQTLIEHWNGTRWGVVASPSPAKTRSRFLGVTAISANDVWAVGVSSTGNEATQVTRTLIEHWNGTRWSIVASPSPGSDSILLGVGRVPHSSTVLAVGVFSNDSSHFFKSLTEFTCK